MLSVSNRYILNFWQAKDIPEVLEEHDKLDIDKLTLRYLKYPNPHKALDIIFSTDALDSYDYIIITSPDLVVKQKNLDMLIRDIEETGADVMCGVCGINDSGSPDADLAVCMEEVAEPHLSCYNFVKRGEYQGIKEVKFNGAILMAIRISLLGDYKWFESMNDYPFDLKLCQYFIKKKIPIMTNFDNEMIHLRYTGTLKAGRAQPEIILNGLSLEQSNSLPVKPLRRKFEA